jgi:hypothetical protein
MSFCMCAWRFQQAIICGADSLINLKPQSVHWHTEHALSNIFSTLGGTCMSHYRMLTPPFRVYSQSYSPLLAPPIPQPYPHPTRDFIIDKGSTAPLFPSLNTSLKPPQSPDHVQYLRLLIPKSVGRVWHVGARDLHPPGLGPHRIL